MLMLAALTTGGASTGGKDAFEGLFRELYHPVLRFFAGRGCTQEECQDLAQETFLRAWRSFDCCHAATLHRPGWRVRSVPPDLRPVEALPPSPVPARRDAGVGPRPLMLAACRDDEPAWELPPSIAGEYRGGARRRATGQRLLDLAARPDRFGLSMELFRSRGGGIRDAVALGPEAARERFLAEASRAPVRLGPLAGKSGG